MDDFDSDELTYEQPLTWTTPPGGLFGLCPPPEVVWLDDERVAQLLAEQPHRFTKLAPPSSLAQN